MGKINHLIVYCFVFFCLGCSTKKSYRIVEVQGSRVEMDSTWDENADSKMIELVDSYKNILDAEMNIEIGIADKTLTKAYPQGSLSNFSADIIKEFAEKKWGNIDFAIVNNGGIRSSLNKGVITIGNLFDIYPYDSQIVQLDLSAQTVHELFSFLALIGGEALSKEVQLVIKDRKVKTLLINDQPVDETKIYRVATIDFLAEGNDGMIALRQAERYTDSNLILRNVVIEYIKEKSEQGKFIDAELDNRILIE